MRRCDRIKTTTTTTRQLNLQDTNTHPRSMTELSVAVTLIMKLLSVLLFLLLEPVWTSYFDGPTDCSDIQAQDHTRPSGVYTIYPLGPKYPVKAFCDMESEGGRWTVIQKRFDGSTNFYRPWIEYKMGFGSPAGEHWLGLDYVHHLTQQRKYELLVEMSDFDGKEVSAHYSSFHVDDECDGYRMKVSGFTNGGAGDSLKVHNGQKFSTLDKDQDSWNGQCARSFLGAFWYHSCHSANPNGVYRWGADGTLYAVGVSWHTWKGYDYSLRSISMKIRPVE